MNVYNEAHNLATAIKESDEFKVYNDLRKKIDQNPQLAGIVNDLQTQQLELSMKQMSGQAIDADTQAKMMQLYQDMMRDPSIAEYFQAEMRFSLMMQDVYKILGEAVDLKMPGMEDLMK
jgi:cell fate (sporulation/competence/biofilm development) regulator YlbF (YheA/YmcA/DUF963 family)